MNKTQFLKEQLALLKDKYYGGDTDWNEVVQLRQSFLGAGESFDTVRKGGKLIGEYLSEGWSIVPPDGSADVAGEMKRTIDKVNGTETVEARVTVDSEDLLRDEDYMLRLNGYDPNRWEIKQFRTSKWNCGYEGNTLYSTKLTVAPKPYEISDADLEAWLAKLHERQVRPAEPRYNYEYEDSDKMLLINIADLHYNLQSTMFSSGNEYSVDSAEDAFWEILNDITGRTLDYDFEKIIFTIGGDGLNMDNLSGTTTRGTAQDNVLPFYDAVERYFNMIVEGIEDLRLFAPVEVIYIPGNHDKTIGFSLAKYVAAWFRDDPCVTVDYSPLPRKYTVFGKTLFAFTHEGDKKTLPRLIADEAREYWGDTNFTEVMCQHFHHESILLEEYNMRMQQLPTVSGTSVWSNEKGYRAKRQCKSFIYDKEKGLTDVLYTVLNGGEN